jgi:L-rhamnose-H+ transport protein
MTVFPGYGIALVLLGGVLNGSFVYPMKRLRNWKWENVWFVYSVVGLLIVPWSFAVLAEPHLWGIFSTATWPTLALVIMFGFGWGIGSVLFGLGIARMGLAVGYGIILGLNASFGTLLPLLVLHPEKLFSTQGHSLLVGMVIVLVGILCCAVAARLREQASIGLQSTGGKSGLASGMLICILAGMFSPMLNFSFVFGTELKDKALSSGTSAMMASNAIWALTLTAGFLVNAGYSFYLLQRNDTWKRFRSSQITGGYWFAAALMGVICFGSFIVYGMGATVLGSLGGVMGWPLFMSMSLITSNVLGSISGEWSGAPRRAWVYSATGMILLIVAITVISVGGGRR